MSRIFNVSYLLQTMLGVSALHLSLEASDKASLYKHAATVLQSQALEEFNTGVLDNVNAENVLDVLLFQHLTALHVFCDTFTSLYVDFGEFLDKLVGCIQLLRGVNSVVQSWWQVLSRTELGVVMEKSDAHQNSPHKDGEECLPLFAMLDGADLSAQSIETCRSSARQLQSYFDAENDLDEQAMSSTNMLFAWLITASPEYTILLQQRRPEALVILAFYAILLHRRRESWAVANSGRNLLRQIKEYLGNTWRSCLAWPCSMISAVDDDVTSAGVLDWAKV
ncbi:hypothetical protein AMS68_003651 [Peltaster fructicola]|uniref:C6 transcription factor n=1 Tax=Peltaster fructicola TaxID=286661 RepID=A0A6H0XTS1_9PEZI|nr:hypothetical protein AMS68_003651 [Peltaster fructicola]